MMSTGLFPFDDAKFDADAIQAAIAMAEGLARMMCIARILVENGRTIDLAGLDRGVGLLCAKALDLPVTGGRAVRPSLVAVLSQADTLHEALRDQAEA